MQVVTVPVRLRAMTQLWDELVPPQFTVIVEVALSQAPVQPLRLTSPSVSAAFAKLPSL